MNIQKPLPGEYAPYAILYINYLPDDGNVLAHLESDGKLLYTFIATLSEEQLQYSYEPGKWTIKDLLIHIIDTERIFSTRALCIARGDTTEMPGFEQDDYVANAYANRRDIRDLLTEYNAVRQSTLSFFKSLTEDDYLKTGIANKNVVSVRSLLYQIAGHELHHLKIINERYLGKL